MKIYFKRNKQQKGKNNHKKYGIQPKKYLRENIKKIIHNKIAAQL